MKSLFTVSLEGYDDITKVIIMDQIYLYSATLQLNVKVLVGASNQEKASNLKCLCVRSGVHLPSEQTPLRELPQSDPLQVNTTKQGRSNQ